MGIKQIVRHPLARDTAVLTVAQCGSAILGLVEAVISARLLGPNGYGAAALAIAYPSLVYSLAAVKSHSVTLRYLAAFRAKLQREEVRSVCKIGYALDGAVSALAFIVVALTGWWVAGSVYRLPEIAWLMVSYSACMPFLSLSGTSYAVLSSGRRFGQLAILEVTSRATGVLLVVSLLIAGFGVPGVVLGAAFVQALTGVASALMAESAMRREGIAPWWNASLDSLLSLRKELTSLFSWNYLTVTFGSLIGQVPLMVLGRLRGPEEAGFYRLATASATVGSYLESSLGKVTYPILSARWAAGPWETISGQLRRWTLRVGVPAGAIIAVAIPLAPIAVVGLFGQGYRAMVPGLQLMMIGVAVSTAFFWLTPYFYARGQVGLWAKAYGAFAGIVIAIGSFAIYEWGFFGIAAVAGAGKTAFTLVLAALSRRSEAGRPASPTEAWPELQQHN